MATKSGKKRGCPKTIYPWVNWFAGDGFTAVRGVDYNCEMATFVQYVRTKAMRLGVRASVDTSVDGTVVVRILRY